jgi:hypothetical protein
MMLLVTVTIFIVIAKAVANGDAIIILTEFAVTFHNRPTSLRTNITEGDAVIGSIAIAAHIKGDVNIMARIYAGCHIARIDLPVHIMGGTVVIARIAIALH